MGIQWMTARDHEAYHSREDINTKLLNQESALTDPPMESYSIHNSGTMVEPSQTLENMEEKILTRYSRPKYLVFLES